MYYVPDGTKECGYYECKKCGNRFLSMQTMKRIPCPDCEAEIDYEIGPDESLEYSCAMKSHFRKFGNQMSGSGNHLCNYASLLA